MTTKTFTALAEPNRLKIVELLREQPQSVNEVALKLRIRQPQASKHLHTLYKAGLVTSRPLAQQRIYALRPEPFRQLDDWLSLFNRQWNERLDKLDGYLKKLKEK